jgi:hypothetical protein
VVDVVGSAQLKESREDVQGQVDDGEEENKEMGASQDLAFDDLSDVSYGTKVDIERTCTERSRRSTITIRSNIERYQRKGDRPSLIAIGIN